MRVGDSISYGDNRYARIDASIMIAWCFTGDNKYLYVFGSEEFYMSLLIL